MPVSVPTGSLRLLACRVPTPARMQDPRARPLAGPRALALAGPRALALAGPHARPLAGSPRPLACRVTTHAHTHARSQAPRPLGSARTHARGVPMHARRTPALARAASHACVYASAGCVHQLCIYGGGLISVVVQVHSCNLVCYGTIIKDLNFKCVTLKIALIITCDT